MREPIMPDVGEAGEARPGRAQPSLSPLSGSLRVLARPVWIPIGLDNSPDEILQLAARQYRAHQDAARALVPAKLALLRDYDAPGMDRAATICHWGRSGSVLLASYFDGHDEVITLPNQTSEYAYPFCGEYQSLSLWEKLIAYPAYSQIRKGNAGDLFLKNNPDGDFAVEPAHYFASVQALFAIYGDNPIVDRQARRRFFQFLHVAYAGALDRPAVNPRPLMISAQHWINGELAQALVDDFPDARFLHTIRDPISALDSWLERHFTWQFRDNPDLASVYRYPAFDALRDLLSWDAGHRGLQERTRAIRFEDMHLAPERTMRRLAEWLGVPYRSCLLDSTLNGRPYVVEAGGRSWVGPNPDNARRRSKNLNALDRLMVFSVLHRNFVEWDYSHPRFLRYRLSRAAVILAGMLIPTKMEWLNIRNIIRLQAAAALRKRRYAYALLSPCVLLVRRLRIMQMFVSAAASRSIGKTRPMRII
jgi:Sulfotransferase family